MKKKILFVVLSLGILLPVQAKSAVDHRQRVDAERGDLAVEVVFYTPSAVRVMKYPKTLASAPQHQSYSIIAQPQTTKQLAVERTDANGRVTLSSACLRVAIDRQTGDVTFIGTATGDTLLRETAASMTSIDQGVDKGRYSIAQTWRLEPEEVIIGLGQRNQPTLNQRGQTVRIWSTNTNITIPYFASEKGYGLYWDNAGESQFADTDQGTTFGSLVAQMEDYYFLYRDGTQDGVVAAIRDLTGQATMFPLWAMGHWQCRERYKTSDELCDVLDRYRELQIPLDGIVQDWQYWGCDSNWNAMRFQNPYYINKVGDAEWARYLPDDLKPLAEEYVKSGRKPRIKSPQEMIDYVHRNNAHLMISIWANFGPWTKQYRELSKMGALLPFDTWPRHRGVQPYDAFNPEARDLYWRYLRHLYDMGIDAWWTDSTEPDHFEKPGDSDYMTHDGSWRSVKNAFPLVTNKGIYEHQRSMKPKKRSLQMTRCGAFGLQHYGAFSWSGDIVSNWKTMKAQIPSGLNYVACGIPYWNTDIGGFFGWDYNNDPHSPAMQELQVRWMQWGCFMPLMRNHCSSPMVSEIYNFGQPGDWAYDVQKQYVELRYRLLPYIYSTAGDVMLNAGSMIRPLMFDFPHDRHAITLADEYLFGRQLLVHPVTDALYTWLDRQKRGHQIYPDLRQAAAPVEVYLPKGSLWYDFWTGERHEGGRTIQRLAPIDVIPVYVRAGSILPWGPAVQYAAEKPWDQLELRVYNGADGDFTLYEDAGDGYDYEQGQYTLIPMHWDDASRTLTIGQRQGQYKGMLRQRQFTVCLPGSAGVLVDYDGTQKTVKL